VWHVDGRDRSGNEASTKKVVFLFPVLLTSKEFILQHALLGFLSLKATFDNEYIGKIRSWIIGPVFPILVRTTLFLN